MGARVIRRVVEIGIYTILLWLCGASLRVTMMAVVPLLSEIVKEFSLSASQVGLLSVLPIVLFAGAALPGSILIGRMGALRVLVTGLVIVLIGSSLRSTVHSVDALYGATMFMGIGIAIMQPAMPVAVGLWMPRHIALGTAIYANGLVMWEMLPVVLTPSVVLPAFDWNWRPALLVWSLPVLIALAGMIALLWRRESWQLGQSTTTAVWMPHWRDPKVWLLGTLFAGIASGYFLTNAFVPLYLIQQDLPAQVGPMLAAFNSSQLAASLILLVFANRLAGRTWPLAACAFLAVACTVATAFFPMSLTVPAAAVGGFVCGAAMILSLALPALLVPAHLVSQLAAGMFCVGYGVTFVAGSLGGRLFDAWHSPWLLLLPVGFVGVMQLLAVVGLRLLRKLN